MVAPTSASQPNPSNQTTTKQHSSTNQTTTRQSSWNINLGNGGRGRQPFSGDSSQSNQHSIAGRLIIFLIILFILYFIFRPTITDCIESGFCKTKIIDPLKPTFISVQNAFKFVGKQAGESAAYIRGEKTFSWEGDVEERVKTGVWFENGVSYGTDALQQHEGATLAEEFGAEIDVYVGKIDNNVKSISTEIECSLKGVAGKIRGGNDKDKEGVLKLANPYPEKKEKYPIGCYFSKEALGEVDFDNLRTAMTSTSFFSEDIIFNLTYGLTSRVNLPVYLINGEYYNEYYYRRDAAFEELEGGIYKDNKNVVSKMDYETDVEAVMKFIQHPIFLKDEIMFGVQFKNKNTNGKAKIENFEFKLPEGLKIGEGCKYFVCGSEGICKISPDYLASINKQLNKENWQAGPYVCTISSPSDASKFENVEFGNIGDVEGILTYYYTISDKVKISN